MNTTDLFAAALNLREPWSISKVEFKPDSSGAMELHIELSFPRGSKFTCPECGIEGCYPTLLSLVWTFQAGHDSQYRSSLYILFVVPPYHCCGQGYLNKYYLFYTKYLRYFYPICLCPFYTHIYTIPILNS